VTFLAGGDREPVRDQALGDSVESHTGMTDIPLTDSGRRLADRMRSVLALKYLRLFSAARCSGERETCELAALCVLGLLPRNTGCADLKLTLFD
jgi:hypothetical protein